MENKYFQCGCWLSDADANHSFITTPVLRRCKKHQKDLKECSWSTWAKKYAPAQYRIYKRD